MDEALKAKGMIQEQAPTAGRIEEIDALAAKFSRDPGVVSWPAKEVTSPHERRRLGLRPEHQEARRGRSSPQGGLPDYPEEMTETFKKLLEEHNIDTTKYLG